MLSLAAGRSGGTSPTTVSVTGRATNPNAFAPALPCTLQLAAPGNRLVARGLLMHAEPEARPDVNGEFGYLPFGADDFLFDQVNVFWHAQRFLERLERLGLDLDAHPISVRVQPGAGSFTHFIEPVSTIGTGLNGLDRGAKDSDIIVHELTHAVFNPRMPLGIYPLDKGEAIPVLEGIADYFAAAVNGDTRIAEFARPPAGYHDIASDPAVYHYSRWDALPGDPYSRGKVLNGALLEIRAALGETADELLVAAADNAPLRCFTCFSDAVRWADNERYDGAHAATIEAAFARRGIPTGPPVGIRIDAPAWAWNDRDVTARLLHSCGVGPFEVTWRVRDVSGSVQELPSRTDVAVFRARTQVTLEATLRDRNGATYPAAPLTVQSYDPADPNLHVNGIRIDGPSRLQENTRTRFTYRLLGGAGVPPVTAQWSVVNAQLFGGGPGANWVELYPLGSNVQLKLSYRDASGQSARDSVSLIVPRAITVGPVLGPTFLAAGASGDYNVRVFGGVPPFRYRWVKQGASGSVALPDTSHVNSLPTTEDFALSVIVTDALESSGTAGISVRKIVPLSLGPIEGPSSVPKGQMSLFRARTQGGHSPFQYVWFQDGPSGSFQLPNSIEVLSRPETGDFVMSVAVTDAAGSVSWMQHYVRAGSVLIIGGILGPTSVMAGQSAVFHVNPQGGEPPYRYHWLQEDGTESHVLGDSSRVSTRPASRDYTLTVTVRDAVDRTLSSVKRLVVLPAPIPPRAFRVLGNLIRRGAPVLFELPTPDAPAVLEVLDPAGRVRVSAKVPAGAPPTFSVPLPESFESGVYFVRLRRSDRIWTTRFVLISR